MAKSPSDPLTRPVFLDLRRIRFPVGAVASILHRLTGGLLLVAVPGALGLAEYSSRSADHFQRVADLLEGPWAAGVGALILAALVHHLLVGVRILLMDAGIGVGLTVARRSAWGAMAAAGVAGLGALVLLWPGGGNGF